MEVNEPLERTVVLDFNEVIGHMVNLLDDNGIFTAHIDFIPILEHVCDIVVLGAVYEEYTGDSFKDALENQGVPTDIYTELSREFRAMITNLFAGISDFFNDNVHFNVIWTRVDYVATVQVFNVVNHE